MSVNPLNDISAVYAQEVFKPQLGKSAPSGDGPKKVEKGKDDAESSAKRIRQATYDIRYRARREDIKLDQAFTQYMGHTTMSGPEKAAVKEKLGLTDGGGTAVKEEVESKKFKVRVTDKESGKSYVRYATREKINQLRANPNISSVEMTGYGSPYEGEKKKGEATADVAAGKGLAKKDYDRDGKKESPAKEYRGAVHNAIQKRQGGKPDGKDTSSVKEGFSDWRQDLSEVMDVVDKEDNEKKVTGMKSGQKNNIKTSALKGGINFKETVEAMGGELLEMVELDEKAVSKAQQRFMGMVYAAKKGETPASPEVAAAAKGITGKEARKFAKTKHAGLPEVKEAAPAPAAAPVAQTQKNTQNMQQAQQREKLQDRKLASIQKTQLAAKMKQVQQGIPLKDSYEIEEGKAIGGVKSTDVNARGGAATVSSGRGMTLTKAGGLGKDKAIKNNPKADDLVKKHYDAQAKADRRAAAKERSASGEDKVSRLIRSVRNEEIEPIDEKNAEIESKFKKAKTPYLLSKFRSENPGSRQPKKVPGAKETPAEAQRRLTNRQVARAVKHGLTSKEKAETQARAKYDSPRD